MTKREVVRAVLEGKRPPYVPWHFGFTHEAAAKLAGHLGTKDLDAAVGNHLLQLGDAVGHFEEVAPATFLDAWGVEWDRSVDKDIGIVRGCVLPDPTLEGYEFPDPVSPRVFDGMQGKIDAAPDRFRVFQLGFSLYERAWTLRGMANLMMDFIEQSGFVDQLLQAIADWNIEQVKRALEYDIDAVYFGDDWGSQRGLQMGPIAWHEFIAPQLRRMYSVVRDAGKFVFIHSCGKVDELLDELVAIGLDCFNPFQPEVMDVEAILERYRGQLAFHGGLSTQKTLPYGSPEDVRAETRRLLELGAEGSYILAPAHSVEGDVLLENMLAFIELAKAQEGYAG
ncbi:MAG: uroporphyrinogen decarboxylase family protein [Planctomycetota bacterium]